MNFILEEYFCKLFSNRLYVLREIKTDRRDSQLKNAPSPMLVTESGMVTDCKDLQSESALSPMLVTESGMMTDCKDEQ